MVREGKTTAYRIQTGYRIQPGKLLLKIDAEGPKWGDRQAG